MVEIVINANDRRIQYTATGGQTVFPYDFPIYVNTHLTVLRTRSGVVTTLTLTTDYTVSGVGAEAGGNVTLVSGATADDVYTIYGSAPYERTSDYGTGGDFKAATVNKDFDWLTMLTQQNNRDVSRALSLHIADASTPLKFDVATTASRQSKLLEVDATGTLVQATRSLSDFDTDVAAAASSATAAASSASAASASASAAAASDTAAGVSAAAASASQSAAAASAAAAAVSAASGLYQAVVSKTYSDSPIVPAAADEGTLYLIDTSGGNVVVNLSALSTYAQDEKFAFVKMTSDGNTVTVNRGGPDTINDATSKVISNQYEVTVFVGDSATGAWVTASQTSSLADGSVTFAKLQNIATDSLIGRDTAGTGVPESITVGGGIEFTGAGALRTTAFTGDVTKTAGGTALTIAANAVSNAKFRQGAALSVVGVTGNATADVADIAAASDHQVLRRSGTSLGFGAVNLAQANAITGQLPLANGGTGANLTDPNADRVMFWDDSAGAVTWLTMGTNLTITGTTLDAAAASAGLTQIATSTPSSVASVDFSSIPATYNDLVLHWSGVSCATTNRQFLVKPSIGGTFGGTNIYKKIINATTVTAEEAQIAFLHSGINQLSANTAQGVLIIHDYASTTTYKRFTAYTVKDVGGTPVYTLVEGVFMSTSAIDGLRMYWGSGSSEAEQASNFDAGTVTLFGRI